MTFHLTKFLEYRSYGYNRLKHPEIAIEDYKALFGDSVEEFEAKFQDEKESFVDSPFYLKSNI